MARDWRELQRPLRLSIYGFWNGFLPVTSPLLGLLRSKVDAEFVCPAEADVVLCSVFGGCGPQGTKPESLQDAFAMQWSGEALANYGPDLHWGDYHLGFLPDDSDHFYLPGWMYHMLSCDPTGKVLNFSDRLRPAVTKDQLWAIHASHDIRGHRGRFVDELNKYQLVHSYGDWNNNRPSDGARYTAECSTRKMDVLDRYKYGLAFENCSEPWYVTEKLPDALLANTVPIYWGAPNLAQSPFNLKRLVDATHRSPSEARQYIIALESDPARYADILQQPIFSEPVFPHGLAARSDVLLKRILEEKS